MLTQCNNQRDGPSCKSWQPTRFVLPAVGVPPAGCAAAALDQSCLRMTQLMCCMQERNIRPSIGCEHCLLLSSVEGIGCADQGWGFARCMHQLQCCPKTPKISMRSHFQAVAVMTQLGPCSFNPRAFKVGMHAAWGAACPPFDSRVELPGLRGIVLRTSTFEACVNLHVSLYIEEES